MPSPIGFEAVGAGPDTSTGGTSGAKLARAYLVLHEPSPDGTLTKPGPECGRIDFQFNPKELSLTKSASWGRETGKGHKTSAPPQYHGPQPSKLSLEMFFDASDTHDDSVVRKVEQLFSCCIPTDASHHATKGSPPWILFRWGGITGFLAYISSVTAKYTMFTSSGVPIRATCAVQLDELSGDPPRQNPTSGGLVPRRRHTFVEGDSLAAIAYHEYGDASYWRVVAQANEIDDPMRLPTGRTILLPAPAELPSRRRVAASVGAQVAGDGGSRARLVEAAAVARGR